MCSLLRMAMGWSWATIQPLHSRTMRTFKVAPCRAHGRNMCSWRCTKEIPRRRTCQRKKFKRSSAVTVSCPTALGKDQVMWSIWCEAPMIMFIFIGIIEYSRISQCGKYAAFEEARRESDLKDPRYFLNNRSISGECRIWKLRRVLYSGKFSKCWLLWRYRTIVIRLSKICWYILYFLFLTACSLTNARQQLKRIGKFGYYSDALSSSEGESNNSTINVRGMIAKRIAARRRKYRDRDVQRGNQDFAKAANQQQAGIAHRADQLLKNWTTPLHTTNFT